MSDLLFNPVFILFLMCFIIHILPFIFIFSKLAFYKVTENNGVKFPPLSVIITARNEEDNLRQFLPFILEQDYPEFEVVVVNDQSEDDTEFVLSDFALKYKQLQIVTIKDYINEFQGKKLAIMLGIRKSSYNHLVFTDADCKPASNQWLKKVAISFPDPCEIVIGFSPYFAKKTLLNLFIRFDTFYTALQYFSFALIGKPYMGVGRNLAYRKELFLKNGFTSHLHIPYGDDDLFVNKNATRENVGLMLQPESFVFSKPKETFNEWKVQKIRHLKAGREYKSSHKRWLAIIWFSQVIFYISFLFTAFFFYDNLYFWGLLLLKMIITLFVYGKVLKKFNQVSLIWIIPLIDLFYQLFIVPDFSLSAMTSKRKVW